MPNLMLRNLDIALIRALRLAAADSGLTIRQIVVPILNQAMRDRDAPVMHREVKPSSLELSLPAEVQTVDRRRRKARA